MFSMTAVPEFSRLRLLHAQATDYIYNYIDTKAFSSISSERGQQMVSSEGFSVL